MEDIGDLMAGDRAFLLYSDPPWGQGNLNYWQTMNVKMNKAQRRDIPLGAFLDRIFEIIHEYVEGYAVIEYGVRWQEHIMERAKRFFLRHHGLVLAQYRGGKQFYPLHIHVLGKGRGEGLPPGYFERIQGTHGMTTVMAAVRPLSVEGAILLDPACGLGNSAKAAMQTGMMFRGNELNQKRLERTVKILSGGK